MALLEVENLRVRFRVKGAVKSLVERDPDPFIDAVLNVSFTLEGGRTFGLVGESGCGKTTLARAIVGLLQAQRGTVRFSGQELLGLTDRQARPLRRQIAMMFQDPVGSLSPRLTVRSIITEPFKVHEPGRQDLEDDLQRLLSMVGLSPEFAARYPHQLSGGQARRVGVARALALNPKLIIADEPTAGLDVSVQGDILSLLARLQDDLGMAMLIISHNLHVVRHVTDRIGIMYLGRFVEQGRTEEVFAHPRHPYTHALLSANPKPDPDAVRDQVELLGEVPSLLARPAGCEFHTRCPFVSATCRTVAPNTIRLEGAHLFSCHHPRVASPDRAVLTGRG
ncbi:MAG: ABC transporter ATP-binding protein [bacterium]|nr:ABC transporter ATP-binding protein [bacterium]